MRERAYCRVQEPGADSWIRPYELLRKFRPLVYAYVPCDFAEARRREVVPFAPLVSRGVYTVHPLRHRSHLIITRDCRSDYVKVQVSLMRAEMHIAMDFVVNFASLYGSSDGLLNMYVFRPCIDRAQRKSRNWLNQVWITFRGISVENRARLMLRRRDSPHYCDYVKV